MNFLKNDFVKMALAAAVGVVVKDVAIEVSKGAYNGLKKAFSKKKKGEEDAPSSSDTEKVA